MIDEFSRWEPLQGEIPRVIAANPAREVDVALVSTYPQSANIDADCKLLLEVQRFESVPGDAATVEVLGRCGHPPWASRGAVARLRAKRQAARARRTGGSPCSRAGCRQPRDCRHCARCALKP
ncbi:MAG: membrane integrity-associated transporter subunit PqiC [Sulfuritalea sp.]|nr:membrane integrity-associated transporter subunit PqiC [Sulfuritalea sp.]